MKFIGITGWMACLALASCSATGNEIKTDDSLMAHLSTSQRERIDDARTEQDHRGDAVATARQEVIRAQKECSLAKAELELAEARVSKAKAAVDVAETGTQEELEKAREALREAEAKLVPQRDLIAWHECDITRCKRAETLAEREHELAGAKVGLEKARAFVQIDQAAARDVDVTQHEARVRERQNEVNLAQTELQAAVTECENAKRNYDNSKRNNEAR